METNLDLKLATFEYMVVRLIEWYKESAGLVDDDTNAKFNQNNDFSVLKLTKLNFFVCSQEHKLLEIFNDFYAMPLGAVEYDVHNTIQRFSNGSGQTFLENAIGITTTGIQLWCAFKELMEKTRVSENISSTLVDSAIISLREKNPNFILYNPYQLVELNHFWSSWRLFYKVARNSGKGSIPIPPEAILNDVQYLEL